MVKLRLTIIGGTALLLALSSATAQQEAASEDTLIIDTLAPELDGVQLGRIESLNENQRQKISREEGIGFRFERDLNWDGQQELVLLGSYAEGNARRAFALIARPEAGGWARSQLLKFNRDFVIGLGYDSKNRLALNFCIGCDSGGWIEWTGSTYEFTRYPPPGVPGIE